MGLSLKAGTITLPTSGTTWDTTGLGFSDGKILITMWNDKTATGITADGFGFGVGFAKDASNEWSGFNYAQDNVADSVTNKSLKSSVIHSTGSADTVITEHTFNSWITDGFRLNRVSGSSAAKVGYLVLGGSDITNCDVTTFNAVTSGTTQSVNLGYQPDMLVFLAMPVTAEGVTAHASMGVGMACASGTITNYSMATANEDARTSSDTWLHQRNVKAISLLTADTGALLRNATVSITGTGFDVTWDGTPAAAYKIVVCAISGVNFELKLEAVPNSGTTPIDEVINTSFEPKALLLFSSCLGNLGNDSASVFSNSINTYGAATANLDQFSFSNTDNDNAATMVAGRSHNTTRIGQLLSNSNASTTTSVWEAKLQTTTTSSFTIRYDTINASSVSDLVYGVIGAKVSQVSTTKTHKYNIIGKVTNSKTHKWNIIAVVTRSKTHKFNIFKIVSLTRTHKFNIIAKVVETNTHKYNIIAKITASRTHKYNILQQIARTRTHKYNILEKIVKSAVHVYNVIGKVVETNTHKYNIIAKITSTKTHKYNILQRVSTNKTHVFSILNRVSKSTTHKYNVLQQITQSFTHKYNVIGKIVATKTHLYNVIGKITQSTTHKYNITGTVSSSHTHKYNIISPVAAKTTTHKYNIESDTVVTKTTTHKYNILERVTTTKTHLFDIIEQVSTIKTHVFSIIAQVVASKTHKYNIIQKITVQKTHVFSVLNSVTTTKTHLYNVLEAITDTTTHKYNIISKLVATKTHKYDVESSISRVEKTTTHLYDVQAATTPINTEKTHKFNILQQIGQIKTHIFNIIEQIRSDKTHKYNIIEKVTATKTHKYNIISKLSILRTHRFNILNTIGTTTKTHKYNILNAVGPRNRTHKYNIVGKITKTTTHKYGLGGRVSRTSTHRYVLGEFIFRELGGSTHARIRFPEKVQILDILGDLNNKAIANIEIFNLGPANLAIGTVQISDYPFNVLTAETHRPRHRIASTLLIPPIIDTIENQAVCQYIGIVSLEPHPQPKLRLRCSLRLQNSHKTRLQTKGETQIKQSEKTIIKVSASTTVKENDKVVNTASIMIPPRLNLNKIIIPEIMSLEKERTIRTIIKLLKTDDLFE